MEKRLFLAFFITFLFLLVYSYFLPPTPPTPPVNNQINQTVSSEISSSHQDYSLREEKKLLEAEIGNFILTYSPKGGYIKKVVLLPYGEELSFKNIGYIPEEKDKEFFSRREKNKLIFEDTTGLKKEFSFEDYLIKVSFSFRPSSWAVFYNPLNNNNLEYGYQEYFYFNSQGLQRRNAKKIKPLLELKDALYAGSRDRYFCLSLLKGNYQLTWKKEGQKGVWLILRSPPSQISFYLGPQREKNLKRFELQEIISYGPFDTLGRLVVNSLYFLYTGTKNWGISIILLTFIIYIILFPFTFKSTKAMKKMAEIQPELQALREKYKDNLQKFQKEQVELFKKYRINPLADCLPLLFQLPVFFALFQVFSRFIELKGAAFLWIKDLSLPDRFLKLPLSLPYFGEYLNILPLLMLGINLLQQKFTPSTTSSSDQRFISLFLLGFMGVIFYHFSAALLLYWFTQNLLTFIYQVYFYRQKTASLSLS